MGLDTTHNCWHGPYSAFARWRDAVRKAAEQADGYKVEYETHPPRAYQGWWDDDHLYGDALDILIVHSDCDGYIFPQDARALIPRLVRLLPCMSSEPPAPGAPSDQAKLATFIAGLQRAVDEFEIVQFR